MSCKAGFVCVFVVASNCVILCVRVCKCMCDIAMKDAKH